MPPPKIHVAVLFYRLGPYHFARLKAAASRLRVTAVEFSDVDSTYAWDVISGEDGFERMTLFSGVSTESLSGAQIYQAINRTLTNLRPTVVALPGWYDRCSLAALKWCARNNVPSVMMSETNVWDGERKPFRELVKTRVVRLSSAGLVGGKSHADYLAQLGMPRDRIFLGYDSVDNDYFATQAEEIRKQEAENRKRYGLPEKYFLASARFVEKKNLPRLIQAYAHYRQLASKAQSPTDFSFQLSEFQPLKTPASDRLPTAGVCPPLPAPWSLVLLGDGPGKSELVRLISDLGLTAHVQLPGFKQYDELPAYYALASAFIHASTIEQWGLVVNEAMASELPVLVSDRCGCAGDLVQEGRNGFTFDPCNVEQLATLMSKIAAVDFPLSDFAAESRRIIQHWSAREFGENLKAACECAISNPRTREGLASSAMTATLVHLPGLFFRTKAAIADQTNGAGSKVSSNSTIVPNFFIIGAPKSGTTAMFAYLNDHPNVFCSRVKEPHFFDSDASKRLKLKTKTYLSLFDGADTTIHKAIGEASTGYLFSKVAVSEILKFNRNARFIVMLRNPVELVQSWHSEMYFEGVENVADFEQAWRLEKERRLGKHIPRACWEPKKLFYSEWGKLGDQIERLFAVAGRDRVKVILFDDFIAETKTAYEEVLSFLELPLDGRDDFRAANENKTIRFRGLQRGLAFSANYVRMFRAVSGLNLSLGLGLFQKVLLLNSKADPRKGISPLLMAEMRDFYKQDIQKLSALLGRDLSSWSSESDNSRKAVCAQCG